MPGAFLMLVLAANVPPSAPIGEAERLAAQARARCVHDPEEGLRAVDQALSLTAVFSPTAFVRPGRKGEVVEDAYLAARASFRIHRATLYQAMGECLAHAGRDAAAVRFLRRALDLDAKSERQALGAALLRSQRAPEALDLLLAAPKLSASEIAVAESVVDALSYASLQAEIDRVRLGGLNAPGVAYHEGPFRLPEQTRLSTGEPFRLLGAPERTLVYAAGPSGRHTSADLERLKRSTPQGVRVVLLADDSEAEQILRRAMRIYRFDWPVVIGRGVASALGLTPPCALIVSREGWSGASVRSPLDATLTSALAVYTHHDVMELRPRRAWNGAKALRSPPVAPPGLLPEGLAPGEDAPFPPAFNRAVAFYRAGKHREALRAFESLANDPDGWLMAPEARYNRALCLQAVGARDEARRLLLGIGDSRFQEAVDRALESQAEATARARPER